MDATKRIPVITDQEVLVALRQRYEARLAGHSIVHDTDPHHLVEPDANYRTHGQPTRRIPIIARRSR